MPLTRYDPHHWTSHLFDIEGSLVREILGRVATCVLWTLVIVAIHETRPGISRALEIPETAHALVGGALALLLVFRTNSSYDRFWEGRKLWGGIVNETRNLARQASVFCRDRPSLVREIIGWTIAFPYACMHRLRGDRGLGPNLQDLPVGEVALVRESVHEPLAVARKLTRLLDEARAEGVLGEYQQMQVDQNIQLLIDYIGACERIHSTPIPFAYAVHLRRALFLYCLTLPFALAGKFAWGAVPATLIITYILFGIEEIGVEIEDPFGTDTNDLPLEQICERIEATLRDVMPGGLTTSA